MKSLLKTLAVSFFTLLLLTGSSDAAGPKSTITISPFLHEVRFSADEATKDFSIEITNNTSTEQSFNLSVLDFGSLDESGGIVFAGSDASTLVKKYGLAQWLQLSQTNLSLGPNKTKEIKATILNDSTMTPGGHYAAIIASINSSGESTGNEININQQLSSLILATKVGGEAYDLKLEDISLNGNWLQLPDEVTLSFKNPGNVHVVPRGTVKVLSSSGGVVASGVINQESSFVLPETTRVITLELTKQGKASLWPAIYTVQVDYRYEGIDQIARKERKVFFLNLPGLAVLVAIGGGLALLAKRARTTRKIRLDQNKHK